MIHKELSKLAEFCCPIIFESSNYVVCSLQIYNDIAFIQENWERHSFDLRSLDQIITLNVSEKLRN